MRHPLSLALRALRCSLFIVGTKISVSAQTFPSTTSIDANNLSLVLPAPLTLTSIVNQPTLAGGVPTGSITFNADGNSLGTAPLTRITATQSFPSAPTYSFDSSSSEPEYAPAGIVAVNLPTFTGPVLLIGNNYSGGATVSLYQNMGAGKFEVPANATASLSLSDSPIDAIASGNFTSPNTKSVVVHQAGGYYVFDGSSSGPVLNYTQTFESSGADTEVIAIDDFDGDGYSDVGVLVLYENEVGIALNQGTTNPPEDGTANPGFFNPFLLATLPPNPDGDSSSAFCAVAITTGKFNSGSNAQLAVLGYFYEIGSGTCSPVPPNGAPVPPNGATSYVVFYTYTSSGTPSLVQMALVQVGSAQSSIAAADFNQDGKLDLVIGSQLSGQPSGQVQLYYGNGDGTFGSAVTAATTIGQPTNITVADFNGDGYPDLAITLSAGGPAILLNDGSGNLHAATQPLPSTQTAGVAEAVTAVDLNGDGLA